MKMCYILITSLMLVLHLSSSTQATAVKQCIVNDRNSSIEVCNNCSEVREIGSIPDLVNKSDIELILCGDAFEVEQPITFNSVENISLRGLEGQGTAIYCTEGIGLSFVNVTDIKISDLVFIECGGLFNSTSLNSQEKTSTLEFLVSIYIYKCTNVTIEGVSVIDSNGTGIAMFDTDGTVQVLNSTFDNNGRDNSSHGGGVYMEFTFCPPGIVDDNYCNDLQKKNKYSCYEFRNCNFTNNNATIVDAERTSYYKAKGTEFYGLGRGGGLCVIFKGDASNNSVIIDECEFTQNEAIWGAGLYVAFHDSPQSNTLTVSNSLFSKNNCYLNGGGAVDIGLLFYSEPFPKKNTMKFYKTNFIENRAKYGGGVKFYSSQSHSENPENSMTFVDCHWERNTAQYGSAIDISPHVWDTLSGGHLPTPHFEHCSFLQNYVVPLKTAQNSHVTFKNSGKGAFICTSFSVHFEGNTTFQNNNGTAMYMSSCGAYFQERSRVSFENNCGFQGGAVALLGFSVLYVHDNSSLQFTRNTADSFGGAIIYTSNNKHDFSSSRSCFIQYRGTTENVSNRNINISFSGNEAGKDSESAYGRTIFATTILPCIRGCCNNNIDTIDSCSNHEHVEKMWFSCIGNFHFNDKRNNEVSTAGLKFNWTDSDSKPLAVFPGQEIGLPFQQTDDLCQDTFGLYHVSVINNGSKGKDMKETKLDPAYTYISNKHIRLFGDPGNVETLQLASTSFREVSLLVEVEIQHCQPGYIIQNTSKGSDCTCSVNSDKKRYVGIEKCDTKENIAFIGRTFWIGYSEERQESEDSLESGNCPYTFCHLNNNIHIDTIYPLPNRSSREELNLMICGSRRTGKLCGRCSENYSTHFHSNHYNCSLTENCNLGVLFYILSELVPVTALFLIIILFKIQLTSGAINGFILFVQVIDTMLTDANGYIETKREIIIFKKIYIFIYRMLNLEFFTLDEISFCIWKGATTMDVLAVKYLTIVYALLLVAVTITVMKLCTINYKCIKRLPTGSVVHGLSAFFVICYAQCTKVTLLVLTPSRIYKIGYQQIEMVVYYQGDLPYMKGHHLKYAIPALLFLIVFVLVPLILLIVYPLCYKVFALLRIEETLFIRLLCRVIPLEKMKPLFDSFQSCFRDNYRFMAGFYFLYRLVIHIPFVLADSFTKFYVTLEIELVLMLTIQATTYPYKKHWHNLLDILLFANLAIINAMTMHNYKRAKETSKNASYQLDIDILSGIQTFLIYLPLVYVVCYILFQLLRRNRQPKTIERHQYDDVTDTIAMVDYRELSSTLEEDEHRKEEQSLNNANISSSQ